MNSFGPFLAIRFCTLGVLTLGALVSPVHSLVATVQSGSAIETPDPYFKGAALKPIEVAPSSPPQISRSYNFQPAAPLAMPHPLAPIVSTPADSTTLAPTRVAASSWPAASSTATAPNMSKPLKGPIIIPPLDASEIWNAPITPVSSPPPNAPQPKSFLPGVSNNVNFVAPPTPTSTLAPQPAIESVTPTIASPLATPQSIIKEQPTSDKPNQFSPAQPISPAVSNSFQPLQLPTPQKSIQTAAKNNNDFNPRSNPRFSFKKIKQPSTNDVIVDSQVKQASLIATQDDSDLLKSPGQQLVEQVGFVQPIPTPLQQGESAQAFEAGKVVAIVGGEPIFVGDMLFEINQIIERYIPKAPEKVKTQERQKMIPQILPKFIEAKLLYHGMLSELPEGVDIDAVLEQAGSEFDDKAMPRLMESAGVSSVTELDAYLRSHGSSLRSTRESWARDQMAKFSLSQKLRVNTEVTHQELLENYRQNYDSFAKIAKSRWEQLMIRFDRSDSRASAKSTIERLSSQVVHGANLAALAKKSSHGFLASEGGQQDWTSKGALVLKEIDEAIFTLPIGVLSGIIETRDGYHIVRVLERVDAGHTSFLDAQVEIKKKIINGKRKEAYDAHLAKLKSEIPVEYLLNADAIARLNAKNKRR